MVLNNSEEIDPYIPLVKIGSSEPYSSEHQKEDKENQFLGGGDGGGIVVTESRRGCGEEEKGSSLSRRYAIGKQGLGRTPI